MARAFWLRILSVACLLGILLTGCTTNVLESETASLEATSLLGDSGSEPTTEIQMSNGMELDLKELKQQGFSPAVVCGLLEIMNVTTVELCFSVSELLDPNGAVRRDTREWMTPWLEGLKQAGVESILMSVSGGFWSPSYKIEDAYAFPYPDGDADSLWSEYLNFYRQCFSALVQSYSEIQIWQAGGNYNLNEYAHPMTYVERNTTFVTKEKAAVAVDLTYAVRCAVRDAGSKAKVLLPTISVSENSFSAAEFLNEIYNYLKSGRSPYGAISPAEVFDAVAWSPYLNWYVFDCTEFITDNMGIREVMEKHGDDTTSCVLTGIAFCDYGSYRYDSQQAQWMQELVVAAKQAGYVGAIYLAGFAEASSNANDDVRYEGMFRVFGGKNLGAKEKAKGVCKAYGGRTDKLDTYKGDNVVYLEQNNQENGKNGIAFPVKGADERQLNISKIMNLLETMNVECMRNWMNIPTLLLSPTKINKEEVEKQKQWLAMLEVRGITKVIGMSQGAFWPDGSVEDTLAAPYRDTTPGSLYMQYLEAYRQSWKTLAQTFPEIKYWEVGNETNHDPFLHPTTYVSRKQTFTNAEKAQITVDMIYYASLGIREANPDAMICFPGMAAVNGFTGVRTFLENVYQYIESGNALGGTNPDTYFDAVAWHMYYFSTSFTADNWLEGNNSIYRVMQAHGDGEKKVFLTEFGFSDGGDLQKDAQQAEYFRQIFALVDQMPYLDSLYPFRVVEDATAAEWGGSIEIYYGMYRVIDKEHFEAKEKAKAICEIYGGDVSKLNRYQ